MLSVIIVHYNSIEALNSCLDSFIKSRLSLPFELIIIDNGSLPAINQIINFYREILAINYIKNRRNLGYARAINQGIKIARGRYLLIINPDILIIPGAIEKMLSFMEGREDIGILAPQLLNLDHTIQQSCFRFPRIYTPVVRRTFLRFLPFGKKELERYLMLDFDHLKIKEVDWVLGAAMMIRKDVLKKVGMMDERFFLYFEDVDLCRRFYHYGFKVVYFPEARFLHHYARHSAQNKFFGFLFNKFFWHHSISGLKYFLKWHKGNS
jgi:GT2 family glycosyltransferase|uniref:Glycosyltransferase family 2 protein n=1 Tax=candidate division WOR-3 bacterium TaxID=2052148 RepID=A0A7V3RGF5_UNCW3